jgi:hypothetical protein
LKAHLVSLSPEELRSVRPAYYWLRSGQKAWLQAGARKAGFKPDQPRWPKGSGEDGGRWSGGPGTGAFGTPSSTSPPRGHHFVNKSLYENLPLRPETRKVFEQAATGPFNAGPHRWSAEHSRYNDAVAEQFERFMRQNSVQPQEMTPEQAGKFVDEVKRSSDPRIRSLNIRIYMREIMYWLRRVQRGND